MGTYNAEQLRQLLAVWKEEGGYLDAGQIRALLEWEDTPDDARPGLETELARQVEESRQRGPADSPAPLTPLQSDMLRESGLEPEPEPEPKSESIFERLRRIFSRN